MREEVWAIVRAAMAEAAQPLIAKQRDLEERLARAEQAAQSRQASIPITAGPSLAPEAARKLVKLSVPPGTYGVAVVEPTSPKPDLDLANVGPIHDMPNFAGRSKTVAKVIAALMVLAVVGAIVATVLSHS
jgi:hypothetical protein